jgi:hypothetical protein
MSTKNIISCKHNYSNLNKIKGLNAMLDNENASENRFFNPLNTNDEA